MSTLGSDDLQNSATACLASQSDQSGGQSVWRPFYGELRVDEGLKLSNENFKQLIENSFKTHIDIPSHLQRKSAFPTLHVMPQFSSIANVANTYGYFFNGKVLTPLSQLTATPPFPTPHNLAQFASKIYTNYKTGETDTDYETRLDLPDGWKLLTTASNVRWNNGYFGAAYWHPQHHQVVIAHRGTEIKTVGSLWTDLFGVIFENHVPQMSSASTFAHKVVEVLQDVNRLKPVSFQLFFTGHSLGGWLAQVTTFTTNYLKREGNVFLKSYNGNDNYHPHTVVFDSPGCKDMLAEMRDIFDVRLSGRSIGIEHLVITSYLSAPNCIYTCNSHLGTVYRIFIDLSDMGWRQINTPMYNLPTHSMNKIVHAFYPKTG
jgi:hypothetical protein